MKIFNKQRLELLKKNRVANYLVYAFGEIILVIIGILIALGINNWNQKRQLTNSNKALQNQVKIQLEKDILTLENFGKELDSLQETYMKVLGRDYDQSMVDDGGMLSTILFEVNTLSLDKHVVNLIDNAKLDESRTSQDLVELSSLYKIYAKDIDEIEKIIYKKKTTNLEEIEATQPWYTDFITDFVCSNDCITYLLTNEEHKSRIASLRFLYINGYGSIISSFHEDLIAAKATYSE